MAEARARRDGRGSPLGSRLAAQVSRIGKGTSMSGDAARVLGPNDGKAGMLRAIGVRFMVSGERSGGGFALIEHPMPPRALAAPLHRHGREDEYTFVLEGRVGARLGDDVLYGLPGDLLFKPRDEWHTFWNAGDEPARSFDHLPGRLRAVLRGGHRHATGRTANRELIAATAARYGLELDFASVPSLIEEHGLTFGPAAR